MNNKIAEDHWSHQYEDRQGELVALCQDFQIEIDESIKRGDIFSAAQASFGHAFSSFELGDKVEGQSFMFMAGVLALADVTLAVDALSPNPSDLDLPKQQVHLILP